MQIHNPKDMNQLVDAIAAGNLNPSASGPTVVKVTLWDKRVITGSYYEGPLQAHIYEPGSDIICDLASLQTLIQRMLDWEGSPAFITDNGSSDSVCTLIWEMKESKTS